MNVNVTTALELTEDDLERWRSWQRLDPRLASPFLTPELARLQARHNKNLRVAVLEDAGEVVGYFPFDQKSKAVAHVRFVMCAPDFTWDAQELMAACGASVFEFDYLVDHQLNAFQPHYHQVEPAPVGDLSDGWQTWLKEKTSQSSQIKEFVRKQRKLGREIGDVEFTLQSDSHEDLELLMRWKSDQLVRTGRVDRFADPSYRALFHDLLDEPAEHFAIHLSKLTAGGRILGLHLTATSSNIASVWHTAHASDADLGKYSVGMILMMQHMENASNKGMTKIEFGKGAARYKELFKNYDDHVVEGWSERPTVRALARRMRQAPKRVAYRVVLGNPRLRVAARETLNKIGTARTKLRR